MEHVQVWAAYRAEANGRAVAGQVTEELRRRPAKAERFVTYQTNVAYIEALNAVPGWTYYLSDSQFVDMTISEYRAT